MSEPKKAVLAFFAVAAGRKFNKSKLKKDNEKYIDPAIYEKYRINSYAVFTHAYELSMIKKYADKYNIKIYDGFINSSNSSTIKYGYHIEHFHMLYKEHQIPTRSMPQQWSNVKTELLSNIVKKIISENPQIQHYQQQYDLTMKLLSIYQDNLTLVKNETKKFEFRPLLKIIPTGNEINIKRIFENHNKKTKLSLLLNQNAEYNSKISTKNKRKNKKKKIKMALKLNQNMHNSKLSTKNKRKNRKKKFQHQHIDFINAYIQQANHIISCKAKELQVTVFILKQNDLWYKYVFKHANEKWGVSWNDFVENKQFKSYKNFQCIDDIDDPKTLNEVTQMFNEEQNKKS